MTTCFDQLTNLPAISTQLKNKVQRNANNMGSNKTLKNYYIHGFRDNGCKDDSTFPTGAN